jgi:hypothetical protein
MADIPTPARVALARRCYREGMPFTAILAETGLTRTAVHRCLAGDYPDGSGAAPAPIPLRYAGARASRDKTTPPRRGRAAVIERIWQTAERQVDEIDRQLSDSGLERNERDGGVRTLAVVAKTLRDLAVFDDEGKARGRGPRGGQTPKDDDDESVPRNIDDLRRALTRKLDAFVAARADRVPDDAE